MPDCEMIHEAAEMAETNGAAGKQLDDATI
jgi:hypothetical protein